MVLLPHDLLPVRLLFAVMAQPLAITPLAEEVELVSKFMVHHVSAIAVVAAARQDLVPRQDDWTAIPRFTQHSNILVNKAILPKASLGVSERRRIDKD